MAVSVKRAILWRRELENRPGTLAETLRPFAESKQNLQIVMGYAFPGEPERSAVEVYPVDSDKAQQVAREARLSPAEQIPCVLVDGDDRVGLAHEIATKVSEAGVNIHFVVIQVIARRYAAIFGFGSEEEAFQANEIITEIVRASAKSHRPTARRTTTRRTTARRAAPKRGTAKRAPSRKAAGSRKTTAKKSTARKTTVRKTTAKGTARKSTARKSTARKSTATATARKTTARKSTATATARKTTARKTTARKSTARKSPARKPAARKTTSTRKTTRKSTAKKSSR